MSFLGTNYSLNTNNCSNSIKCSNVQLFFYRDVVAVLQNNDTKDHDSSGKNRFLFSSVLCPSLFLLPLYMNTKCFT